VLRSNADTLANSLSGIVINKTSDNEDAQSYGIMYNPTTDSVDLCHGSLSEKDDEQLIEFIAKESKPLTVRCDSKDINH
jgi:hypothetical protein